MNQHRHLAQALIALTLIAASTGAAQAADGIGSRVGSNVGRWIAAQGNAALQELQQDLKRDLVDRLKPLLPASDAPMASESPAHKVGNDLAPAPAAGAPKQSL